MGERRARKVLKRKRKKPLKRCPGCGFKYFDGKTCRSGVECFYPRSWKAPKIGIIQEDGSVKKVLLPKKGKG